MNRTSCGSRLVSSAAEIARALQHRAGRLAQIDAELVRDDVRQRGLAQPRRSEQQYVVQRFVAFFRRRDEDRQLFADFLLPDVLRQAARPQRAFDDLLVHAGDLGADDAIEFVVFDHGNGFRARSEPEEKRQ